MNPVRLRAHIRGAVQGVGFRPYIYLLASEFGLSGFVINTPQGVVVESEGETAQVEAFLRTLPERRPPLSLIDRIEIEHIPLQGGHGFEIRQSEASGDPAALIMADIATCADCLRELRDPADRRYRYPFLNCTHCGPRFTILERLPYDRPNTAMKRFAMCAVCRAEYENPRDRRFHAQPVACPACGPQLALWDADGKTCSERDQALAEAAQAIRDGRIVAVKGLGGFHLMADARNRNAVLRLRARKRREEKPFAMMYPHLDRVLEDCVVGDVERRLLESPECPIVLLARRADATAIAEEVAPGAPRFGVMLPATPLHHLLMEALGFPVVATSGNLSEEPICIDEHEARRRLGGIAECFLVHDRPIVRHADDSIAHVVRGRAALLRRARGYAPLPVRVGEDGPPTAAFGGHLKNTVAVSKQDRVFLSQHIGDLETTQAFDAFLEAGAALRRLYAIDPVLVACDSHPDYLSARHARGLGLPVVEVQHHYAHVLACMAEHGLPGPVLGVAWDGTGHGPDGTVWGGEFLRAERGGYVRVARVRPFPLPGGDAAVREPRRAAQGLLYALWGGDAVDCANHAPGRAFEDHERKAVRRMLERGVNAPMTSSAGRLFDGAAAICGLRMRNAYEGQAAMLFEYAARRAGPPQGRYRLSLREADGLLELDWAAMVAAIVEDAAAGRAVEAIASEFHDALARGILEVARHVGLPEVVLGGGCFQNALLTEWTADRLEGAGFRVFWPEQVPANDGGIALGQTLHAMRCAQT